jgi:hypothetical protein
MTSRGGAAIGGEGAHVLMRLRAVSGGRRLVGLCCLVAPVVALLAVPVYAGVEPAMIGLPLFYWYPLGWVLITPALLTVTSLAHRRRLGEEAG